MAQDFAKSRRGGNNSGKKQAPRAATRKQPQASNPWSWYFSGLFSGVLLCVIGYYAINHLRTSSPISNEVSSAPATETGPETDLQFYDYLPQAEVEVNVVPVEVADSSGVESDPVTYLLQAASFQDPNDADELRAKLLLLNMDVRIQPTPLNGQTWYRVQAGPFIGRRAVEAAQNILRQNNIDPIRLRIPSE